MFSWQIMALFFNIKVLEEQAGQDTKKFIQLLEYHYKGTKIVNKWSKYKPSKVSLKGNSFLLNPVPVLYNTEHDPAHIVQYIRLAGRRDLMLYKTHGFTKLDTSFYPDLIIDNIKHNPLLTISNKTISFKFEEIYNGSQIWRNQGQGS
jgi:hypothetical protein